MNLMDLYNMLVGLLKENTEAFVAFVIGLAVGLVIRGVRLWSSRRNTAGHIRNLESSLKTATEVSEKLAAHAKEQDERLSDAESKAASYERLLEKVEQQDGTIWMQPVNHALPIPEFVPLGARRKNVIISVFNLKGGVGKTTLTANLGVLWAQKSPVLLVDLDYQQSLTDACAKEKMVLLVEQERVINHVWQPQAVVADLHLNRWWEPLDGHPNAFLVGVRSTLAEAETKSMVAWLAGRTSDDVRFRLRHLLHRPDINNRFGHILIDCPPRLTTACIGALAASDYVIIPVIPDDRSIDAVGRLVYELGQLREAMPSMHHLRILGVAGNRMNSRMGDNGSLPIQESRRWNRLMQNASAEHFHVFNNRIRLFTDASKSVPFQAFHRDHQQEFEALRNEIEERIACLQS